MSLLLAVLIATIGPTITGTWSIAPVAGDRVHYDLRFQNADGSENDQHSSDVDLADLGLTSAQADGSGRATFSQVRDAGTFAFEGWIDHRRGGGTVTFTPSQAYLTTMRGRGYDDITPQEQLAAATLDISVRYADSMAATGYTHLTFRDLITFRALRIDDAYVRSMRNAFGSTSIDARDIVSLRALDVTTDYLREIRAAGFAVETPRAAVELRALKIDAAYVAQLAAAGYPNLTSKQLVELKALGIDGDFIKRVHDHGITHPSVDQLVQLKALHVI